MGLLDRPDGKTLLVIFIVCALGLLALALTALRGRMANRPSRWSRDDEDAAYPSEAQMPSMTPAPPPVKVIEPPAEPTAPPKTARPPAKRTAKAATKTTAKRTTPRPSED